jgi:hypothetical protein
MQEMTAVTSLLCIPSCALPLLCAAVTPYLGTLKPSVALSLHTPYALGKWLHTTTLPQADMS